MSLLTEKTAAPVSPPAPVLERAEPLNLAGRPFTNTRPVTRAALILWILGILLLLGNVSLFWNYLSGSAEKRAELARMEGQIEKENRTVAQLEGRLANSNLDQQNREVRFLNRKIAERTFSWSLLFDRLSEVLPEGVRLTRLAPTGLVDPKDAQASDTATAPVRPSDNRVTLSINGEAKSDEALLHFVDRLFAHPAFEEPDLTRESREEEDLVKFDIKALYLPSGPPQRAPVVEEASPSAKPARTPAGSVKPTVKPAVKPAAEGDE
jgi:Tfp pilus assembly protein PilN